jgi:hypothetical protein
VLVQGDAGASVNHTVGDGVWVEDNYVPWGGKLCLTPADATTYQVCTADEQLVYGGSVWW